MALGLLAFIDLANAGQGFIHTTAATSYGWIIPIVAGGVIGLVALALLAGEDAPAHSAMHPSSCKCSQCGGTVLGEWRLCPHCGARLSENGTASTKP
ncbi:MAG TPA: hypothetical protein VLA05_02540 [Coriobacteriia bacterium]|nr:hypothetical protein [Coriobacteriia bacterium]